MIKPHEIQAHNYRGSTASLRLDYWETDGHPGNQPQDYEILTPAHKDALRRWIEENFKALKNPPKRGPIDSYTLKHYFEESERGFYISNGQFKGAMLAVGHAPLDETELNWVFRAKLVQGGRS